MAQIDRLGIQGIRSFGPEEARTINFLKPLTLILGQNGCGKTTIIESLKYISTGEVPPGCGRGASFVHDPKMAKESSVRGQVKLRFTDARGKVIVSTRSLVATQKPKSLECKTLDATMIWKQPDGSDVTLSSRCAEFNASMTAALGVSKAILNNVIFCHQEDSNWPLDEGKKVKDKFDEIFNATKYIKCLETIRKLRADMKGKIKNMKDILFELKKWKDEANRKRVELKTSEEKQTNIITEKETLTTEMKPIVQRLKHISTIEADIGRIREELSGKQYQLKSLRKTQEELRATLTEQLKCSDEELYRMIQDFQRDLALKETEQRRVESSLSGLEREVQKNQMDVARTVRQQGELEAAHNRHKNYVQRRDAQMIGLVEEFTFSEFLGVQNFKDEQADSVLNQLLKVIEDERASIMVKKQEFEKEEVRTQREIDGLRSKEAALDHDIKNKGKQLEETAKQLRQVKHTLKRNESELSAANLDDIKAELTQVEEMISAEESKLDVKKVVEDIDGGKKTRREIEHKLDDIKRVVAKMNRQAEARSQYDIHVKEKKELENKIEYLKRKHTDELEHLLGEVPDENIKNKVDACTTNLKDHIAGLRRDIERINRRKTQLDTSIKGHKQQIERKENEIKDLETKIDNICQGKDLDNALEKSKKVKEELSNERGDLSSSITVLNRFTERLKQRDCCPLCHRDFSTKDEVNQLIEELDEKVSSVPGKLKMVQEKLIKEDRQHDQMIQLKPQRDQANRVRAELVKIRSQMDAEVSELEKVGVELESKTELMEITQGDEETARMIQPDVFTIEQHLRKVKYLKDQIDDLQGALGSADGGMSMEEAMGCQSELEEELRKCQSKVEGLQEHLQEHKERLQSLKDRKLRLSTKELNLRTKLQETEKLKEDISRLDQDRTRLEEEREQAQVEVAPYKYQIKSKTEEKTKIIKEKESWIEKGNLKVNAMWEKHRSVNELQKNIVFYVRGGEEERLKERRQQVASLQEKAAALELDKKSLEEQNRKIQKEISNQKERKRSLDDEKKIRDKEAEAKLLEQNIKGLEDSIQGLDYESIVSEKYHLNEDWHKMQTKRAALEGRLEEIAKNIRLLENDLGRKEIRDAEKNYKVKYVEMKCMDLAADDLNKYYKALDTAIMRFHSDKMNSINGIIRELWRTTYKGNDIDYIEIKTTDGVESQGADKRRIYNYRVVMIKNEIEMDMRGRCSAGQKVLASLIIRLALAETFSSNCGILALDEPTTNLDRENVVALSLALLNIVERLHIRLRNFQLIIITHDTDFLERMTHNQYLDNYYLVSRNER
ncbi:DNA repair protein RAD50-like isoform X2 [Homarus americanus]|nr:DNA repair protein RAD50-like isoform X2 [Homarus americanus]